MGGRRAGCWRPLWCWRALTARWRPGPAGWAARRCGSEDREGVQWTVSPTNGCTAAMPRVWAEGLGRGSGPRVWAEGLVWLVNRTAPHRPRRLAPDQMAKLANGVEAGPDPARDGVVRWRRKDLQARIEAEFGVALHERSVGKQWAAPGFRRLSVRPRHPKSDPDAQVAFTCDDIVDACCKAWNRFANNPNAIASITSRNWAKAS
jgi:transposase